MEYHDESYGEQMEAQEGPYENEPPMLFPSDVDKALRRIEHFIDSLSVQVAYSFRPELYQIIALERERLGIPTVRGNMEAVGGMG